MLNTGSAIKLQPFPQLLIGFLPASKIMGIVVWQGRRDP